MSHSEFFPIVHKSKHTESKAPGIWIACNSLCLGVSRGTTVRKDKIGHGTPEQDGHLSNDLGLHLEIARDSRARVLNFRRAWCCNTYLRSITILTYQIYIDKMIAGQDY